MNTAVALLFFFYCAHTVVAGDVPPQLTKSSTQRFKVEEEVKAFYLHLIDTDAAVKHEFESITAKSREANGNIFYAHEPRVTRWFPSESSFNVNQGFKDEDNYLVVQPVGWARSRHEGDDDAVVAEFHVVHTGITRFDEAQSRLTLISNKLTIVFLGFRRFEFHPIPGPK